MTIIQSCKSIDLNHKYSCKILFMCAHCNCIFLKIYKYTFYEGVNFINISMKFGKPRQRQPRKLIGHLRCDNFFPQLRAQGLVSPTPVHQ